nr:MAG TPA: Prokaryotic membrane lipoprotein lipid attachment site [Caudoviricetes sp.]
MYERKKGKLMKKILFLSIALSFLAGCGTTTTTTTYYQADGKTIDRVVVEQNLSDVNALGDYLRQADSGAASDRSVDVTKFTLGYADIGLSWLSVGGNSTRSPATATDADKVLGKMASVKSAGKTTIQTDALGVNTDKAAEQKTTESK